MSAPIPLRRILMRRGYAALRERQGCPAGLPTNITIIPLAPKCPELNLVGRGLAFLAAGELLSHAARSRGVARKALSRNHLRN